MRIGDIVVATDGFVLHCGSGIYSHAICVGTNPLVLSSDDGTMLWWKTLRPGCVKAISHCQADPETVAIAVDRYARDVKHGMAPKQIEEPT